MLTPPPPAGRRRSRCACVNLRRASRAITDLYDAALRPCGLRVTQYSMLRAIHRAGTAMITEIAERLALDRTTMSRNLRVLERAGLIEWVAGADRRARRVRLSATGKRLMERAVPYWEKAQAQIARKLGAGQLESLLSALSDLEHLARQP
ncbi:MAG: winged helix-turn-helix transcriptional regulator [Betaproteobacteria bacterium]|nr:winged helix-turn-helix transcriptional regulator [Betaproteobacteria bacterium]